MENLFRKRPFKTRNADEYNLTDILSLFVNPINGLSSPVDFENSIIKGRMGSGKTMYLRANYAYYLFNLIPSLIEGQELILPVFIKLSDFQHLKDANEIYKNLIIKLIEELSSIFIRLQDAKEMANIHMGMKRLKADIFFNDKIQTTAQQLLKLGSEEYINKLSTEFGAGGKINYKFIEASANFKKNEAVEIKQKASPGINDIILCYENLLRDSGGKILLLIDEAGSLDKTFFREESSDSFFEIFMNQLRTCDFIRTKIAIYPNSYSDILTETRYGDVVALEESIDDLENFGSYKDKVFAIIGNYLNVDNESTEIVVNDIFDCENIHNGSCIEEIINGSGGNYRRLIQLLDSAMNESFKISKGSEKVNYQDAISALKKHCSDVLSQFSELEKEYLFTLGKVCKSRSTYRFKYPNNAQILYKYMTKSQEFNLVKVVDAGSGRKGTTYAFDYSFCVLQDIPTHYIRNSEKIDKLRSLTSGEWISRVTNVNEEILAQTQIPNKIEGEIDYFNENRGFIKGEDSINYFFQTAFIIESDFNKRLFVNKKVRFNPTLIGDTRFAMEIEVL